MTPEDQNIVILSVLLSIGCTCLFLGILGRYLKYYRKKQEKQQLEEAIIQVQHWRQLRAIRVFHVNENKQEIQQETRDEDIDTTRQL